MVQSSEESWESLWSGLDSLRKAVSRSKARVFNSKTWRSTAKGLVKAYFRDVRIDLRRLGLSVESLDKQFQTLLQLSNTRSVRTRYFATIKLLRSARSEIEPERELSIGKSTGQSQVAGNERSPFEQQIMVTLDSLAPEAGVCYRQAVQDLSDQHRISFRGTAAELREAVRGVLDTLAPSDIVEADKHFKLVTGQKSPTMKQKASFVLRSRDLSKSARANPEKATSIVEESTAALARSVYDRGSASTHTRASRGEMIQLKMYVDSILCELLEIHGDRQDPVAEDI